VGAAGAIESIVCILAIKNNVVPATINSQILEADFKDKFDFVLGKSKSKEINIAINNTFGFGGHIATTLYRKYRD